MKQLLIVEDDRGLGRGLCLALRDEGLSLVSCPDIKSAREQLLCGMPDLILLDVCLPDGSGTELLREIKSKDRKTPVILLTANDTEEDIVTGLDMGADDYITKPFSLSILRARVKAQLRRGLKEQDDIFTDGKYRFDFEDMRFFDGDREVSLSKTEQKLLRLLTENRGRTVSRAVLLDRVWAEGTDYVDENALSVAVKRLRDKLEASGRIKTVYGLGYQWAGEDDG